MSVVAKHSQLRSFISFVALTFGCGIFAVSMLFAPQTRAANGINRQMNYQAKLLDASGNAVANGTYSIQFSLYDAASAGTRLWTATGTLATPGAITVNVQNGLFTILLGDTSASGGSQNSLDGVDWNSDSIYLGVTVNADAEMTPRKRLSAAPQAFNSQMLQGMYASSSIGGGNSLFVVNQNANNAATGTRTALEVRSKGTSSWFDYLFRGVNDLDSDVFTINRQGSVTSSGYLAVTGAATSTFTGSVGIGSTSEFAIGSTTFFGNSYLTNTSATFTISSVSSTHVINGIDNTFDTTSKMNFVTSTSLGGIASYANIFVQGRYAYAVRSGFLDIWDVSNPGSPTSVGSYTPLSGPQKVVVQGNYAYVANFSGQSLSIIDVSTPASPTLVKTITGFGAGLDDVAIQGQYAYVIRGGSSGFLSIIDISDPVNATSVSTYSITNPFAVAVQGKYAYVAAENPGSAVLVLDVSNPRAPSLDSFLMGVLNPQHIIVNGDNMYVGSNTELRIYNVASPTGVLSQGLISDVGGTIIDMALAGRYIYVLDSANNIRVIDVQDVSAPAVILSTNFIQFGGLSSLAVNGKYAFIGHGTEANFGVINLGGIETSNLLAHAADIGRLFVDDSASIFGQLHLGGSLDVGGGIVTNGSIAVTASNVTSTFAGNIEVLGNVSTTRLTVAGRDVCLLDGTNCPAASAGDSNWTYVTASGYLHPVTSTNDIVLGNSATSTGAAGYFDLSGQTDGTSTIYFGFATNTNVIIGGTSSSVDFMNTGLSLNGNDLFVAGNIGSASSVYTNGELVLGPGSTHIGDGYIMKNDGSLLIQAGPNSFNANSLRLLSGNGGAVYVGGFSNNLNQGLLPQTDNNIPLGADGNAWSQGVFGNAGVKIRGLSDGGVTIQASTHALSFHDNVGNNTDFYYNGAVAGGGLSTVSRFLFGYGGAWPDYNYLPGEVNIGQPGTDYTKLFVGLKPGQTHDAIGVSPIVGAGATTSTIFAVHADGGVYSSGTSMLLNLMATNATTTNATTTNLYVSGTASTTNLITNTLTVNNFVWTNATGSNTTSTNLAVLGTASSSNMIVDNLFTTYGTVSTTDLVVSRNTTTTNATTTGSQRVGGTLTVGTNVGIGTQTINSTDALAIVGSNAARESITVQNTNSAGNASFYFQNDRGSFASYGGLLQGGSADGSGPMLGLARADKTFLIADGASNLGMGIGTLNATPLTLGTNNAAAVTILSGGNVGIGTINPGATLDVSSANGGASTGIRLIQAANNVSSLSSYVPIDFTVPTTGLVGQFLATASNYSNGTLNLSPNSIALIAEAAAGQLNLTAGGASGYVTINSGGYGSANERLRITSDGKVGIGTTAPSVALDVNGTVSSTNLFVQGNVTSTNVTTTNLAVLGTASSSNLIVSNLFTTYGTVSSTNLVVSRYATTTNLISSNVTTTNLYVSGTASSTNLFANGVTTTNLAVAGTASFTNVSTTNATTSYLNVRNSIDNTLSSGATVIPRVSITNLNPLPWAVAVAGKYAYVAHNGTPAYLSILNVSNPAAPSVVTSTILGAAAESIALNGHYVYVAESAANQAQVIDVSNPASSTIVWTGPAASPKRWAFNGGYAYLTGTGAVYVVDATNPTNLQAVAVISTLTNPYGIATSGKYLYVTDAADDTLHVFDVSRPEKPIEVGSSTVDGGDVTVSQPRELAIQNGFAYVANVNNTATSFGVINISDAKNPTYVTALSSTFNVNSSNSLFVSGRYAYLLEADSKLHIIDIGNPSSPAEVASNAVMLNTPQGVAVSGRYAYVNVTNSNRMEMYDVTGIETNGLMAGSAEVGTLQVLSNGYVSNQLGVGGTLYVGRGGVTTEGVLTVMATNTTSTIYGNLAIGTSTLQVALNSNFVMNGDDLLVGGNIASVSSVFTNGAFVAGPGSTWYGNGYVQKNDGDMLIQAGPNSFNSNNLRLLSGNGGAVYVGGFSNNINAGLLPQTDNNIPLGIDGNAWSQGVFGSAGVKIRGVSDGGVTIQSSNHALAFHDNVANSTDFYYTGYLTGGLSTVSRFLFGYGGAWPDYSSLPGEVNIGQPGTDYTKLFVGLRPGQTHDAIGVSPIYSAQVATSTIFAVHADGGVYSSGTSMFVSLSAGDSTTTNATTTNLAITGTASTTQLIVSNLFTTYGTVSTTNLVVSRNATTTNLISSNVTTTALSVTGAATTTFAGGVSTTAISLGTQGVSFAGAGAPLTYMMGSASGLTFAAQGTVGISMAGPYMYMTTMYAASNNAYNVGDPALRFLGGYFTNLIGYSSVSTTNFVTTYSTTTNATTTNLAVSGNVSSNLIPSANNTYTLGSALLGWGDMYSSGTFYGANMTLTGTSTAGQYSFPDDAGAVVAMDMAVTAAAASEQTMGYEFDVDGMPFLQMYSRADAAGGLQTTSTAVKFYQPLLPSSNNLIDLGSNGTNALRNIYASGTSSFIQGLTVGNATSTGNFTVGTSTLTGASLSAPFAVNGDDLYVGGNIGSASSVFTNGAFVASTTGVGLKVYGGRAEFSQTPVGQFAGEVGNAQVGIIHEERGGFTWGGNGLYSVEQMAQAFLDTNSGSIYSGASGESRVSNISGMVNVSGTVTGVYGLTNVYGGGVDVQDAVGVRGMVQTGGGTVNRAIGVMGTYFSSDVALVGEAIGLYAGPIGLDVGSTVNLAEGLKVDPPGYGTTQWTAAIGTGNSYVAGSLRVGGTTAPLATLDVNGTASSTNLVVSGGATTTRDLYIGKSATVKYATNSEVDLLSTSTTGSTLPAMALSGNILATSRYAEAKIDILDVTNPKSISVLSRLSASNYGLVSAMVASGNYVYTVEDTAGGKLSVIQLNNGKNAVSLANLTLAQVKDIAKQGNYAYVPGYNTNALYVVAVGIPLTPFTVSSNAILNTPFGIAVQGDYAYVTNQGDSSLKAIDISDPANPSLVSSLGGFITPGNIAVSGRYAYLVNQLAGSLNVVDISHPATMAVVASSTVLNTPRGLQVSGRYLYVSNSGANNTLVFDISDPTSPTLVKTIAAQGTSPYQSIISGRTLYSADYTTGNLSTYELPGMDTNALVADAASVGRVDVGQDASVGGNLIVNGGAEIGDAGLKVSGPIINRTSSTFPGAIFGNTASSGGGTAWAGFFTRLLVGENVAATGTANYYELINYRSSSGSGLCLDDGDTAPTCPAINGNSIEADGAINASAFDVAERYPISGSATSSDLLVWDDAATGTTKLSPGVPYDSRLAGVVSSKPGFLLGWDGDAVVALAGRVPTKVSPINGAIHVGDPLTSSIYPGVAMKATKPGMIVGYALDNAVATSTIEVSVKVGYYAGSVLATDGTLTQVNDNLVMMPSATASTSTPSADSWGLTFRGSAWDGSQAVNSEFSILNDVSSPTSSEISIRNSSSSSVFSVDQAGNTRVSGDVILSGKLYPSARGVAQTSKYIFLDDSVGPTSTYMATNADGWQANDSYDFAERYYSPDSLEAGDLVLMSQTGQLHVQRASDNTHMLMGIVSTRPAFVAGRAATSTYPIALAGRVPTKVSTMNGTIHIGDPLSASTIPGVAVKATQAGPIVGMALENYDMSDVGKIEVYVNPTWWGGDSAAVAGTTSPTVTAAPTPTPATNMTQGLARIISGGTKVHISIATVHAYPHVIVTPHDSVGSEWWTENLSDTGFDIRIAAATAHDITFSWEVTPAQTGETMFLSDGTFGAIDPGTGALVVGTSMTTTTTATATSSTTATVTTSSTTTSTSTATGTTTTTTATIDPAATIVPDPSLSTSSSTGSTTVSSSSPPASTSTAVAIP